jgi:hypothetical protein
LRGVEAHCVPYEYIVGAGLVMRSAAISASGWLTSARFTSRRGASLSSGEDGELVVRIRKAGYQIWYNPAMRIRHVMPAYRGQARYMARLRRSIGHVGPTLEAIRGDGKSTFDLVRDARSCALCVARVTLSLAVGRWSYSRLTRDSLLVSLAGFMGDLEGIVLRLTPWVWDRPIWPRVVPSRIGKAVSRPPSTVIMDASCAQWSQEAHGGLGSDARLESPPSLE